VDRWGAQANRAYSRGDLPHSPIKIPEWSVAKRLQQGPPTDNPGALRVQIDSADMSVRAHIAHMYVYIFIYI